MFTLAVLLCGTMQCVSATSGTTHDTEAACKLEAEALRARGLQLIDQGQIEPHTFDYQCIKWGRKL